MRATKSIIAFILSFVPPRLVESFIYRIVDARSDKMNDGDALRFLFRLDSLLYSLEGQRAIGYGGGVHTKHRHTNYHNYFIKRIGPDDKVIDIGCGIGALSYSVAQNTGASVVGIDINEDNIQIARERRSHANITYEVGDVLALRTREGFDVAIISNVLEHLKERPAFLKQLKQNTCSLRFLIRVPLFERDWRVPLRKELGVEYRLDDTHETEYTQESFVEEINEAGLKIIHYEVRWGEIWAEVS